MLEGVRISGLAGDQQAALVGNRCLEVGSKKQTYGTGCFMYVLSLPLALADDVTGCTTRDLRSSNRRMDCSLRSGTRQAPMRRCTTHSRGLSRWAGAPSPGFGTTWASSRTRKSAEISRRRSRTRGECTLLLDLGDCLLPSTFDGSWIGMKLTGISSWDSAATGMLIGLSGYTTKQHICRATLEAVSVLLLPCASQS